MTSGSKLSNSEIAETLKALEQTKGNKKAAATLLGISRSTFYERLAAAEDWDETEQESTFAAEHLPPIGTSTDAIWEIKSDKHNKFRIAAFGDLHAASKYCRWDVREDLIRRAEKFDAQVILDTGNWIDGERDFNRYDLEVVGLDSQLKLLAERYPKTKIPTYAVTGADHEGWYSKSNGTDVGLYCEATMRSAGHLWTNLGYIESDIILRNSNSGSGSILRVAHPGGGAAYALSYAIQKAIESYEGGEKPTVGLFGHYHKMWAGIIRNVWVAVTGCQQDQTPFMRQKKLEAHIGGILIEMEQNPEDGSIISFTPTMYRYFNKGYYFKSGQANNRWSSHGPIRQIPRTANALE